MHLRKFLCCKPGVQNTESEIYQLAGKEFNMRSGDQLGEIMNNMGIYSPKLSPKTKKQSWDVNVLKNIDHPLAAKILEYRAYIKC